MTKKANKETMYNDSWIYILLLCTLTILIESLKSYSFNIKGFGITDSIFLLPLVFFITNYINKKYDYKRALVAVAASGVSLVAYFVMINFALGRDINLISISGEFCGYVISQLVNMSIYTFLMNNTKQPVLLIYLNYMFSLIVFYVIYTLIYLNMIILDDYWSKYILIIIIQLMICLPIAIVDKFIKRGQEKDK